MATDLLDNQVFSGFLLIAAGCTLALQSGTLPKKILPGLYDAPVIS